MSTIEIQNLTKVYGDLTAVNQADLKVDSNEVLCLLGPSGCGKTTTLRMIAGLEPQTSGEIIINNNNVNLMSTRQRNIAMAFQFYALYPSLTVSENLANPLFADNLSQDHIDKKITEIAEILQLQDILYRKPHQLAEGEKQRVAVGRAIIRDPQCFLFDEPLSRLDVQLREKMRSEIKEVLSDLNKATVIVTHDQLEALTMATKIAVMKDGFIEQVSTPHDIFAKPENTFVAGFIGTPQMNLVGASLEKHNNENCSFKALDQSIEIKIKTSSNLSENSNYTLGIRPRSFEIESEKSNTNIAGEIDLIENMGAEILLHMKTKSASIRAVLSRSLNLNIGNKIFLLPKEKQVHLFGNDGKAIN
jgi:multiple sugar transport system ATP-binding protein